MDTLTTQPTLPALERERDRLVVRLERLNRERDPHVVESFHYVNPADARKARGRLMCSTLRNIEEINAEICRLIYPHFRASPSEGFSDRVMHSVRGVGA